MKKIIGHFWLPSRPSVRTTRPFRASSCKSAMNPEETLYRSFSRNPPGGWGFFLGILENASKNKTPTPWGFSRVFPWDFVSTANLTRNRWKPLSRFVVFSWFSLRLAKIKPPPPWGVSRETPAFHFSGKKYGTFATVVTRSCSEAGTLCSGGDGRLVAWNLGIRWSRIASWLIEGCVRCLTLLGSVGI